MDYERRSAEAGRRAAEASRRAEEAAARRGAVRELGNEWPRGVIAAHERALAAHTRASDVHRQAAELYEEHARDEREQGNLSSAERAERRAESERQKADEAARDALLETEQLKRTREPDRTLATDLLEKVKAVDPDEIAWNLPRPRTT